jgi:RiboL-PSP-HEPN
VISRLFVFSSRRGKLFFRMPAEIRNAIAARLLPKFNLEIGPYYDSIGESLNRTRRLIAQARAKNTETNDDILRAIVVLTHAYLEDFLRTLARSLLPLARESVLKDISLAGSGLSRPKGFHLGDLAKHRGKTVEEVIHDSVSEHLDRSNFNNTNQIVSFLSDLDIALPAEASEKLSALDRMIQRRHLIVHRADRVKTTDGAKHELQAIDSNEVVEWVLAATDFMTAIVRSLSPSIKLLSIQELGIEST